LNEVFSAFDLLTEKHGLEKIKTIGDAYMVAGGVPVARPDHAEAVAALALDMQEEIERFNNQYSTSIRIRIGISTGPVIAGVIGRKKFAYDLWGDTVNVASRLESLGAAGGIQIAEATYERLKGRFHFDENGRLLASEPRGRQSRLKLGSAPHRPICG
jgi:class 3 adenylate cyclase